MIRSQHALEGANLRASFVLQVLVKKRVVYKILAEHGESFSDCLAAAVGEILDMGPEPSQIPENQPLFKFKDEADDSPDFWRQLAAGAVIRRGVRAWMRRQREKAALTKSGAVLGALSYDPNAPSIQMLPPRPSEDLELARVDLSATKTVAGVPPTRIRSFRGLSLIPVVPDSS